MNDKMSFWGIGPKYTFFSLIYCSLVTGLSFYFNPAFKITLIPDKMLTVLGSLLIIAGIPFYIASLISIKKAYNDGRLVTDGMFAMCRHPVYAAWIVFFVPGIMLIINIWSGLTAPPLMYLIVRVLVREEENYLEKTFGDDYLQYKERVPLILPLGRLNRQIS